MRRIFLALSAPILLGACAMFAPDFGFDQEAVVCGEVDSAPVIYTKEGFPITDDQAPILVPCPEVLGVFIASLGDDDDQPPIVDPPPIVVPPPEDGGKCNSGKGNGSEGDDDCDPGKSGDHNQGGD